MERPAKPDAQSEAVLTQALDRLWVRFLPEMKQRLAALETAAAALAQNSLSNPDRQAAHAAAHKLSGVLGTFGLKQGSDLAHELEVAFANQDLPGSSSSALATAVAELRRLVENRQPAS